MKEILIKLRLENRYSQSLLSKVLGISRQAYMKYESGDVEPSVEIVRKLSKIYQVPYDVIIDNGKSLSEKKSVEKNASYSKSRSFNKDEFFKKVGKLNIDGSYVNKLRENSLT